MYIGNVYIPPVGSNYAHPDPFLELKSEINEIENEFVLLVGDFNSRTGEKPDYIECDENILTYFVIMKFLQIVKILHNIMY